jgi:hypothetical protein
MGNYYNPDDGGFSASSWLGTIAGAMYNEYLDYWGQQNVRRTPDFSDDHRRHLGLMMDLASALRRSLHSLTVDDEVVAAVRTLFADLGRDDVDAKVAAGLASVLATQPIIDHGIQIALAQEASDQLLEGAERRFGDLINLLAIRRLSERARAYLDRATRLYLWGFEPEAIVMCAAALEAAYEGRFSDLDMFKYQITKEGKYFEAFQYERAAVASGVYSRDDREMAQGLREARNDVVHAVPAVALTAKDALDRTATLLDRLFPA